MWHGSVTWGVPAAEGGSYTGTIRCGHDHELPERADACSEQLARSIERGAHPDVQFQAAVRAWREATNWLTTEANP